MRTKWPHEKLQIKLCLAVSLIKTRQYKKALEEIDVLGNLHDTAMQYQHYPHLYGDKKGMHA